MPPPSSSSGGGTGGTFDRANPLFARPRVPCQFLSSLSAGSSTCNGSGHGNGVQPQRQPIVHYTLRILEGRRPCGNGGNGGLERCIRFEITDECAHTHENAYAHGQPEQAPRSGFGGFGSPSVLLPPSSASGPPMMQMQMQMQPTMHCCTSASAGSTSTAALTATSTCNNAPIHTYELEVGETDFAKLRRDQALLVDFGTFADSFVSLLGYCDLGQPSQDEDEEVERYSQPQQQHQNQPTPPRTPYSAELPRYACRLEEFAPPSASSATSQFRGGGGGGGGPLPLQARFSIVESNQFRELVHLSLNLRKGTDATTRSYLSSRLHQTMADNAALRSHLKQQIGRADEAQTQARDMAQQMQQLKASSEAERTAMQTQARETLKEETARQSEESRRLLHQKDAEMQALEANRREEAAALRSRIGTLEDESAQLSKDKASVEDDNARLRETARQQTDRVETLSRDCGASKSQVEQLSDDKAAASKSLHEAQIRIAALEQSKTSQEQALDQSDALRRAAEVGAATASDTVRTQSAQLQEARGRIAELEAELATAEATLSRYQRDRSDVKQQVKEKTEEVAQRDALVAARDGENAAMRKQLDDVEARLQRVQIDKQAAESELTEAKQKLVESAKLLQSNQQVITFLNREINSAQLGRVGGAASTGLPPSSYTTAQSPSKRYGLSMGGGIGGTMGTTEMRCSSSSSAEALSSSLPRSHYSSSLAGLTAYLPPAASISATAACPSPSPVPRNHTALPPATCPRPSTRTLERADPNSRTMTPPR